MIENHRIKRGLLRLGEATVSELSCFAACEPQAVIEFLQGSPDIVEPASLVLGGGAGEVSHERWHLRPEGRERLRSELVALRAMATPDLDAERVKIGGRLRDSIRQIKATLATFEEGFDTNDTVEFESVRRRIRATRSSARKLDAAQVEFDLEVAYLDEAEKRLDHLEHLTTAPQGEDADLLEAPVADCLVAWAIDCAAALGEGASEWDEGASGWERFVPSKAEAGAVVIVEADSSLHWMTKTMVDAARSASAPVMRLKLNLSDKPVRARLLDLLSGQIATAAGAAAKVVFTIDSRRPEWADFVVELKKFDYDRSHPKHSHDSVECTWKLLDDASKRLRVRARRDHAQHAPRWEVASVEDYLVGALLMHMADDFRSEHPRAPSFKRQWSPHVRTICIDAADSTPLGPHLKDSDVVVFGLDQLRRLPNHGVSVFEPLPLTHRAVPSPSQRAWRAVFVPAVERCDE